MTPRPEGTFPFPFRYGILSDLRGEKQGKRHVANLVLQLLDPVDMCILILENGIPYKEVCHAKDGVTGCFPAGAGVRGCQDAPG
jgi:hypothetical protein